MRGRDGKGPQATDLLVCFPTRAHLSLMPKPICSPARPSDSSTRHHRRPSHHQQQMRKLSNNRGTGSPLLWGKSKHHHHSNNNNAAADISSEPTSPKVTCAGQIKVRTKPNSCKNWQSVMEEIERLHNSRKKQKKRPAWIEAFGFKKDVMQFLTCLRNIRFDFRCFGSIPAAEITSDDDEEDDEEDLNEEENVGDRGSSGAVFSKWFMILQEENLSKELIRAEESSRRKVIIPRFDEGLVVVDDDDDAACAPPPPNALLLMRCRSAPAKSWLEEREEEERERSDPESEECEGSEVKENGKKLIEEESKGTDFCEFAVEIANENRIQEKISRSRSWKR
ncbi:hypothetical protein C2S53_000839 [Perilla frutescens var. hirtella]|uniref:Uncharacterized protein n=1 Tax=Perilla frutescens var. hirtella TaxID=608512 RepID=A0AAD4IQ44_PERFH|nr:hypothetical protein C2S53_000839 [Perilla frutescens var. hirtella]